MKISENTVTISFLSPSCEDFIRESIWSASQYVRFQERTQKQCHTVRQNFGNIATHI